MQPTGKRFCFESFNEVYTFNREQADAIKACVKTETIESEENKRDFRLRAKVEYE